LGDPKKQRKKHETPRFPWRSDAIESELRLLGEYGLRNKRELWRHRTIVSKFRSTARSLLSKSTSERAEVEAQILGRLKRLGVLPEDAVLDNVLDLTVESALERRLQTIVFKKGLAKTIHQARQLITHGHIAIGDRRVFSPSCLVFKEEEDKVTYAPTSALTNTEHTLRQSIEVPVSGGKTSE